YILPACVICLTILPVLLYPFFFFNVPATTELYTLSLHDALPISVVSCRTRRSTWSTRRRPASAWSWTPRPSSWTSCAMRGVQLQDRKSTRLNSSHVSISYAVFCLKKKKKYRIHKALVRIKHMSIL